MRHIFCCVFLILLCVSQAQAARVINSVLLNGSASTTVSGGDTIIVTVEVTTSGSEANDDWESTSYTLNGSTVCVNTTDFGGDGTYTDSFNVTAPTTDSSYTISVYAHRNGGCNPGSDSNNFQLANAITVFSGSGSTCEAIFPDGASSNDSGGNITFGYGSKILNSPDNILDANNLTDNSGGVSCNGVACGQSGSPVSGAVNFPVFSGGANIFVAYQASQTLAPGSYGSLSTNQSTVILSAGDYIFSGDFLINYHSEIQINGSGTVRIFVDGNFTVESQFSPATSASPGQLAVFSTGNITIGYATEIDGFFYSEGDVYMGNIAAVTGAVTGNNVTLESPSIVNYNRAALNLTDFGSACSGFSSTPANPVAEYRFEESSWSGVTAEVLDESGNAHHATAEQGVNTESSAPAIAGDPGTCRYGEFDGSNDYIMLPNSLADLTGSFTITAWINADTTSGDRRILVDDQNNSSGFGFSLGDVADGRLRFFSRAVNPISVDSQGVVINSGQWHFVAAVHDVISKTRQIYVDGSFVNLSTGGSSSTYTGTWGRDPGPISIGGETSSSGEFNANFQFNGSIDELRIYDAALADSDLDTIMAETHPCTASLIDHYAITVSGSGLTCEPSTVTITGHDSSHNDIAPGSGTVIALSTSTNEGAWSNPSEGSVVDNGSGDADYTFAGGSSITLSFNHPIAGGVNFDINAGSSPNEQEEPSPDFEFKTSGFRIIDGSDVAVSVQTSGRTSEQLYLQAIADDGSGLCMAAFPDNTTATVDWAVDCNNPASCIGGTQLNLNYSGGSQLITATDAGSTSYTALTMEFGANAKTPITINYPEAGEIILRTQYTVLDGDGNPTGETIAGANAVPVVPVGFCVEAQSSGGADPSCTGTSSACSSYVAAGENFTINISARASDDSGDSDYCSNSITENFFSSSIELTPTLVAPLTGINGALSVVDNIEISAAGNENVIETFSEVGVFTFTASDTYFGESLQGTSANVGRFIPASFVLVAGSDAVEAAYSDESEFTYLGQPFFVNFMLEARSALSPQTITQNYFDDFAKLDLTDYGNDPDDVGATIDIAYGAVNTASFNNRVTAAADSSGWVAGVATVTMLPLSLERGVSPEAPLATVNIGVLVEDSDGVTFNSSDLDLDTDLDTTNDMWLLGTHPGSFYYGRTFFPPVYGPEIGGETAVPFVNQYFNGSGFVTHTVDSSTDYAAWDEEDCIDGTISCGLVSFNMATGPAIVDEGRSDILAPMTITRPGLGNAGSLTLQIDVDDWLEFDWNGAGEEDPYVPINFGIYRGHDRILYWKEVQSGVE